jgi:TetR/AcrR family fatty acid metabolism transcriptional regulator
MTERSVENKMPKIIDKREKRGQILDAAIRVLARKGLNKTKIADIARAAGVGKGTIYEYFRSRDEIIAAGFRHFLHAIGAAVGERWTHLDRPLARLEAYFAAWGEILGSEFLGSMELVLDIWAESVRRDKEGSVFDMAELYQEYRLMLEGLLDECIAAGELKPVDTRVTASVLLGTLDGLLFQWVADRTVFDIKEAVRMLPRLVIDGLKASP